MENKKYVPTDSMRTNPLSLTDGGSTVTVLFDGYHVEYTNIKAPFSYISSIRKAKEGDITLVGFLINGEEYDMCIGNKETKINKSV